MNNSIKDILEKCNEAYSKGDIYFLKDYECKIVEKEFNITIPHLDVDDHLYDILYYCAKEKWPDDKFFNKLTSDNTGYGKDIEHEIPMGSMEELKEGDLAKWIGNHKDFVFSDKLDGCSVILTYINGKLSIAATRGHGTKGKDIMRHIKQVHNVPQKINHNDKLIVRGELLFKKNMIQSILDKIELKTGKKQKNGRNTIAGALNRKETDNDIFNNCKFVAYWTSENQGTLNAFKQLESLGFTVPYYQECSNEVLTDENCLEIVKTRLKFSDYELDGIIITQNDYTDEGFVGGTINPKCSRKFKMGIYDNVAESIVTNINWQISRWGIFTPVLEIEPVEVAGALITNITAHNYENVVKMKCGVGAKIKFKRAGLVIPKLEEVLEPSEEYNLPKCNTKVNGVDLEYVYTENDNTLWREIAIRKLEYFGDKLEIDMLGYGNCAKIIDAYNDKDEFNIAEHPEKIFELDEEDFVKIIGKNGKKIYKSLENKLGKCTEVQFATACGAFGPNIGEQILQSVWDKYKTLDFQTKDSLNTIDGFGDNRVKQYIDNQNKWVSIRMYMNIQCDFEFKKDKDENNIIPYSGYTVCFSGVRDKDFAQYIRDTGGFADDRWESNVNVLVVKDMSYNSQKVMKAKKANVRICTLDELKEEMGYNG